MSTDVESEVIREYILQYRRRGYLPTVREIADHLGVSVSVAHKRIKRAEGLRRVPIGKDTWRWDVDG